MNRSYILAIDQGTTGTTTILYNQDGELVDKSYRTFTQLYPQPGWVEHDPMEIWQTVVETVGEILRNNPVTVSAVGITNQRETTILWDARTGKPVHNAIVWQCRRTASICEDLREHEALFKSKTGLPLDAYFSGTKIKWLLEHAEDIRGKELKFGTIDTWLIWMLTGGRVHATDYTNASRTLLFNINTLAWDAELCERLDIPMSILPEVRFSADDYGRVESIPLLQDVPISGVIGDQQAALFGQRCFNAGQVKTTYGTGAFMLLNTGAEKVTSEHGLLTTIAADGAGKPCYALEGSVFIAGAAVQWLRDELRLIHSADETEAAALSVENNGGVYLVPAFVGLGAPHWNMRARGTIVGLTRGSNRNHIIRATLESIAFQTYDLLTTMEKETGVSIESMNVDGGATANRFLMQFQADLLQMPLVRPDMAETTALGAAYLAGMHAGVWKDENALRSLKRPEGRFLPQMAPGERDALLSGWQKALRQTVAE